MAKLCMLKFNIIPSLVYDMVDNYYNVVYLFLFKKHTMHC